MKRLWPTILLVVICVAGFWYASSQDFFKEKKAEAKQVFTVNKDDVTGYKIQSGDTVVELQKKDGGWTMTQPSAIPLNGYSADGWVETFGLTSKDKVVEENAADLAPFGLAKPQQIFTVTLKDGGSKSIRVGDPLPIPGFFYAAAEGSNEVFRLGEQQVNSLNKKQLDFMEKSPIKVNYDLVTAMTMAWKGGAWTLTKSEPDKKSYEAGWKLGDKELKGSDATQVLDKAIYMATGQLVKPSVPPKAGAPDLRIEVKETDAGKETATVYTGQVDGDNVWIAKQGDTWSYAIPAATVQELFDKGKQLQEESKPQ